MRRTGIALATLALGFTTACSKDETTTSQTPEARAANAGIVATKSDGEDNNRKIAMRDNCDPRDPAWAPTGGCLLRKGDVTVAEFGLFLRSPLTNPPNGQLIGHPSWRNEPSHLAIESGRTLRVTNEGGRTHTFTEVKQFGGGRVPPLNVGLTPAPECATAVNVPAGVKIEVANLTDGIHRFECCIHPWMRATVRVQREMESM
jgi:plastocyanin